MHNLSPTFRALSLAVAAMACFSLMSACIRSLAPHMHPAQMVFIRNVMSLGLMGAYIAVLHKPALLATKRPRQHLLRSVSGFFAMELWFFSLTRLPLNVATALSFTTPVFGTLCAIWLLKEKAGWRRWCAIGVSFVGVLVILRPGAEAFSPLAATVLVSSCLMALSGTAVKSLSRTEAPETIVFYMAAFLTAFSLVPALFTWGEVTPHALGLLALIALFSTCAQLLMAYAYRHADMVTLLPMDFLRLVFTAILAYFLFSEIIDGWTVAGAGLIMASSVYIVHREAVRRKGKVG